MKQFQLTSVIYFIFLSSLHYPLPAAMLTEQGSRIHPAGTDSTYFFKILIIILREIPSDRTLKAGILPAHLFPVSHRKLFLRVTKKIINTLHLQKQFSKSLKTDAIWYVYVKHPSGRFFLIHCIKYNQYSGINPISCQKIFFFAGILFLFRLHSNHPCSFDD